MKKIIFITIACLSIPYVGFAQEPNSLLGIENTLWQTTVGERGDLGFGFYDGKVYIIWPLEEGAPQMVEKSFYVDLLLFSFGLVGYSPDIVPGYIFAGGICFLLPTLEKGICMEVHGTMLHLSELQDDWTP